MTHKKKSAVQQLNSEDRLIVGSLSGSRLKSVCFLVGESSVDVASSVDDQIIKINHQLTLPPSPSLKIVTYLTDLTSYIVPQKHVHRSCHLKNLSG
jgi:hypothetical protein